MLQRLFTYGSLMPGKAYAHLLEPAGGDWQAASVQGFIEANGWGHSIGYPALILSDTGPLVPGMLLSSRSLLPLWPQLDEYEGIAYRRIETTVRLKDGNSVTAFVYELHPSLRPTDLCP